MTTYECEICYGVNHVKKLQCSHCGTIPKQYSLLKSPSRILNTDIGDMINGFVTVVAAYGVDRTERHRTCKRILRTVPADYYADMD